MAYKDMKRSYLLRWDSARIHYPSGSRYPYGSRTVYYLIALNDKGKEVKIHVTTDPDSKQNVEKAFIKKGYNWLPNHLKVLK